MTTPVPGFAAPSPRTWSKGDDITTPRLRGDMANLAYLYAGGARPMLVALCGDGQSVPASTVTPLDIGIVPLNTWNVPVVNSGMTNPYYQIPLAGWYLVQANGLFTPGTTPSQYQYATGFATVVNGAASADTNGSAVPASTLTTAFPGGAACELFQFNTYAATADTVAMYYFTNNPNTNRSGGAWLAVEWAALPSQGATLTGYTGPYGAVVSSPQAAAPFPPGPGTTLAAPVSAGATSITVASNTGMVTGGTLGLDYIAGQLFQPVAEAVSITSVAGTTIGISATSFAHSSGAPVAVPVSAAFLNQQCRDIVNFLSYPPMLRAQTTTTQSIPSQTFPAGTQITNLSAASLDNFGGFASNAYTAPVAGTYLIYGQVSYAGSTGSFAASAGLSVAGGTIQWGTRFNSDTTSGAQTFIATVRRVLRLTAGQTITLYGSQNSGSSMSTLAGGTVFSKLIVVWRTT